MWLGIIHVMEDADNVHGIELRCIPVWKWTCNHLIILLHWSLQFAKTIYRCTETEMSNAVKLLSLITFVWLYFFHYFVSALFISTDNVFKISMLGYFKEMVGGSKISVSRITLRCSNKYPLTNIKYQLKICAFGQFSHSSSVLLIVSVSLHCLTILHMIKALWR